MSLEQKLNEYRQKANQIQNVQTIKKEQALIHLRSFYDPSTLNGRENSLKTWQNLHSSLEQSEGRPIPMLARVEVTDDNRFKKLDKFFFDTFDLSKYFPERHFSYPIVFCETLEEFYEALVSEQKLSRKEKQILIDTLVKECKQNIDRGAGVTFGVDISGVGCYINGWLFGRRYNLSPNDVLRVPEFAEKVAEIAVHEKIGHGFLSMFSAFGQALNELGLRKVKDAERFGLEVNTDPLHRLRIEQYITLLNSSYYQQEGWATWIESYFLAYYFQINSHPKYQFEMLKNAIEGINPKDEEEKELKQFLNCAFLALIDEHIYPPEDLLNMMGILKFAETKFDNQLAGVLNQPLRYVIGQLLMYKVEINAGFQCVPHAALLAGNIKLDVNDLGLQDLKVLLNSDPRLNADTRLVMISKMKLNNLNDVSELARRCEEDLSMPVPVVYKQSK